MDLSQSQGFQKDTSLRYFQESGQKDLSQVARVEFIIEKLCGILEVSATTEHQAKDLYMDVDDLECDEVALGGAMIWIASNNRPLEPRWEKIISEACMELCRSEDRISHRYNKGYWDKRVSEAVNNLKSRNLETDQVSGVDYMWEVLKFFKPSDLSSDQQREVRKFCLKMMPMLENSPDYFPDGNNYMNTKRVALAGALLYVGVERVEASTAVQLDIDELAEDLGKPRSLPKYVEMIKEDFSF